MRAAISSLSVSLCNPCFDGGVRRFPVWRSFTHELLARPRKRAGNLPRRLVASVLSEMVFDAHNFCPLGRDGIFPVYHYQAFQQALTMHIYAFGSVCRGDVSPRSPTSICWPLLRAMTRASARRITRSTPTNAFGRYGKRATHLLGTSLLSPKMLFASDKTDFLSSIGKPGPYHRRCRGLREVSSALPRGYGIVHLSSRKQNIRSVDGIPCH